MFLVEWVAKGITKIVMEINGQKYEDPDDIIEKEKERICGLVYDLKKIHLDIFLNEIDISLNKNNLKDLELNNDFFIESKILLIKVLKYHNIHYNMGLCLNQEDLKMTYFNKFRLTFKDSKDVSDDAKDIVDKIASIPFIPFLGDANELNKMMNYDKVVIKKFNHWADLANDSKKIKDIIDNSNKIKNQLKK